MGVKHTQAWTRTVPLGKAIFGLYPSRGNAVISADTAVPCIEDGPMVVRRYDDLTIDAAAANVTLTTQYRNRGLLLFVGGNLTLQRSGSYIPRISMAGKCPRGSRSWTVDDVTIPSSVTLQGASYMAFREVMREVIRNGWAICDRILWDEWGKVSGVRATAWTAGTVLVSAAGCPAHAPAATFHYAASAGTATGPAGTAGTNAPGQGGAGNATSSGWPAAAMYPSPSWPWGGGSGTAYISGGGYVATSGRERWYGGDGGGGILIIIVQGNVVVNTGGLIDSDGATASNCGGHGGGAVIIARGGTYTNNGTVRAAGSAGNNGGNAGAGTVHVLTLADLGWS